MAELRNETMTVNMGPQHPSTHGVLRLVLELDGEVIQNVTPTIGYLHTGIEKTAEQKKWQQVIPLVERMDYLGAQSNSLCYALSVEKLLGLEMPQRVKDIRVLIAELQRMASHLIWIGTHAMEIGAVSMLFYAVRERELLLNINERFPGKIDEFEGLLTKNDIFNRRTRGVGVVSKEDAFAWGLVGPIARGGGSDYDVRKYFPYSGYETYDFDVPTRTDGDVFARYQVRVQEMRESVKICKQALKRITPTGVWACDDTRVVPPPKDKVYTEMEALIQHFLIYSQGFTVPAGDAYVPVEGPRGEHGVYVVSDGTNRPYRIKMRPATFYACQALPRMIEGGMIADVIAVIGSTDVVMGDLDR